MTEGAYEDEAGGWHRLRPVSQRWPWITSGLVLQLIGVAAPVVYVLEKAHKDDVGGQITRATLRLAWHDSVHSHTGLALLAAGAVIFVAGSMLLARPFVHSWLTLFVAIPIAALVGVLVLGAAAIIVGLIVLIAYAGLDDAFGVVDGPIDLGGGGRHRRKRQNPPQP